LAKLKIGVIGVGSLGQHHARVCTELSNAELAGVADLNETRGREIAGRHQVPFFADHRELLKQVDAVCIAAPTTMHFQIAKDSLEQGKQVLVEKPITSTVSQARELIALAEQKKLKLQVGHIERFNPAFKAAGPHIKDPMFLECIRLTTYTGRNTDVSVVLSQMIHDIDIVLSLVNSELERVSASGLCLVSGSEDIANARLEFRNGCAASLTASRISGKKERQMRVFQKDSYITVDYLNPGVQIQQIKDGPRKTADPSQSIAYIEPKIEQVESLKAELSSFAECILNDTVPLVTGRDGLRALQAAEEIMREIEKRNERLKASP